MVLALLLILMSHLYYRMTGRVIAKIVDLRFITLGVVFCISVGPQCRASYELAVLQLGYMKSLRHLIYILEVEFFI